MKSLILLGGVLLSALIAACSTIDAPARDHGLACAAPSAFEPAALYNDAASRNLVWSAFGRAEQGWRVYGPRIDNEVRTACASDTPGFAAAIARWQSHHGLSPDGALQPAVFEAMKAGWQARRPFVRLRAQGVCPPPPTANRLATAAPQESYGGKIVQLRPGALRAYRRMVVAARRAVPELRNDPDALKLFSGYRSPDYDAARCLQEANCDGLVRAACSAHRTGLALDLVVGAAPGRMVDSSADDNRLYQSRTAAYRWLVANAARYGFVNYVYEPWHWEWTGEPA